MLELRKYKTISEKYRFLEDIDWDRKTLLVSDLNSKLSWQNFLINKNGFIDGYPVLRAEDLWKILVNRSLANVEIVSTAWLTAFLKNTLSKEFTAQFGLPYAKPSTALRALNELLPILCHPDSQEIMRHWFDDVNKKSCAWEPWFYLSAEIWEQLRKEKIILSEWAAAFLQLETRFENYWDRDLIVDLGPEIRTIEIEVLQALSRKVRVVILAPNPPFLKQFHWIAYPYQQFEKFSQLGENLPQTGTSSSQCRYLRFTSPLAEVKFVIGQLREWLHKGHKLSEIALIAPDIEAYWPILRWHLIKEGIPFAKRQTTKIGSLGNILAWVAYLKKILETNLKTHELEIAEFHPSSHQDANFAVHKSLWSKRPYFSRQPKTDNSNKLDCESFIQWATSSWPSENSMSSEIVDLLKRWLLEAKTCKPMQARNWIEYLEDYLNQQEKVIVPENPSGLGLYSLMHGWPPERSLQIYLGCSESQLKSSSGFIQGSEVLSLQHHTGHLLAHPDRDFREYQLNLLRGDAQQQFFLFSESDFGGAEQVPSLFWLNGREREGRPLNDTDKWAPSFWEHQLLTKETVTPANDTLLIKHEYNFSLSPASLSSYVSCPFRFYAEKGLKLVDPAIVDLELDPRTRGSLQHRLLELLTERHFDASSLRLKLPEIVKICLEENSEMFFSEKTKELVGSQLEELGERFLNHEEVYRNEFPRFYTLAKEAWFRRDLYVDKTKILFRGKIDRIDISADQKEAVVIDYKNDISSYHNAGSWLKNLEFQLLAYTDSVELGAAESDEGQAIPATTVVAAHYFGLKDFSRKGFTLNEASSDVVVTPTSKSKITKEEKGNLIRDFNLLLHSTAQHIIEGDFRAIPHPHTDCKKCPWRNLCRAPNQNL